MGSLSASGGSRRQRPRLFMSQSVPSNQHALSPLSNQRPIPLFCERPIRWNQPPPRTITRATAAHHNDRQPFARNHGGRPQSPAIPYVCALSTAWEQVFGLKSLIVMHTGPSAHRPHAFACLFARHFSHPAVPPPQQQNTTVSNRAVPLNVQEQGKPRMPSIKSTALLLLLATAGTTLGAGPAQSESLGRTGMMDGLGC